MNLFSGIDLVEIQRIEESMQNKRFYERVYSLKEQALFASKKGNALYESAAANFAAKEAFSKALGTGVRGFALNEVSVLRDELGCPYLELSGKALEIADEKGLKFSVSLTHTSKLAQAIVIAYKEG